MISELRKSLTELNKACGGERRPTSTQRKKMAAFCRKRYLFDLMDALSKPRIFIDTIKSVVQLFPPAEVQWAWMLLCARRPQFHGQMFDVWRPQLGICFYWAMMLEFAEKLDMASNKVRILTEFPLLNIVYDISSSDLGANLQDMAGERGMYAYLASRKRVWKTKAIRYDLVEFAEGIVSSVVQFCESRYGKRPLLPLSGILGDKRMWKAADRLVAWLASEGVDPDLFDLVSLGFLEPRDGVLIPNKRRVTDALDAGKTWFEPGKFGAADLAKPLLGLKSLLQAKRSSGDDEADAFLTRYVTWHATLDLSDQLAQECYKRRL